MGYNNIIGLCRKTSDSANMTVGSYGMEVQEPNSALYSFSKSLEKIINNTVKEYSDKMYSVLVPRVLTYDYVERYIAKPYEINLSTLDISTGQCAAGYDVIDSSNLSHVVVRLYKILAWGTTRFKPTIIRDEDKKEVYNIICKIIREHEPDPLELVSFKLEEDVLSALTEYKKHIEETYPYLFMEEETERVPQSLLRMELNDGLITPNYDNTSNQRDDDSLFSGGSEDWSKYDVRRN